MKIDVYAAPSINPEGIMHGPHAPIEVAQEETPAMSDAERKARFFTQATELTAGSLAIQAIDNGYGEAFKTAGSDLHGALYQNDMNNAAVHEAAGEHITFKRAHEAERILERQTPKLQDAYIKKVTEIANQAPKSEQSVTAKQSVVEVSPHRSNARSLQKLRHIRQNLRQRHATNM